MAGVTTTSSALLQLLADSGVAVVPYAATGTGLLDFAPDTSLGTTGVIASGSVLMELLSASQQSGGVLGSGNALAMFADLPTVTQSGVIASGSGMMDFAAGQSVYAVDGSIGTALLAFDNLPCHGNGGSNALSTTLLEFDSVTATANVGATATGSALIDLFYQGFGYSDIAVQPANPASIDTLSLPYVAFSMNVLTKGVTAYTANVAGKAPCLIATPITDFGKRNKKYVHNARVHLRSTGDTALSTLIDENRARQQVATISHDDNNGLHFRRAKLPKGDCGTNWQFFIENQDGAEIALETLEVEPIFSQRTS